MSAVTGGSTLDGNAIAHVIDSKPLSINQWAILTVALLLNMLDGFDVAAMAFAAHGLGEEYGIAPQAMGLLFSAALAGMMLGAMFLAPLADTVGRRPLLLSCVLGIGISMLAVTLTQSFAILVLLRFITGLGVGGMLAGLTALASEYTPARLRSLAIVTMTAGYPLGVSIGGLFAAPLIPEQGWRIVFQIGGLATLAMAVVMFFMLPESLQFLANRGTKAARQKMTKIMASLNIHELAAVNIQPSTTAAPTGGISRIGRLFEADLRWKTLNLWLTFFLCFVSLYFLLSWIPKLLVNAGLSESSGVLASTAFTGGGTLGIIILGWLATYFSLSKVISFFLVLAGIGLALFAWFDGLSILFFSLAIIGFFHAGGFTGLYAVAAKMYPAEARATGIGWAIGLGRFGAVVGPYVGGVMIAAGISLENILLLFSIPMVVSGLLALPLKIR